MHLQSLRAQPRGLCLVCEGERLMCIFGGNSAPQQPPPRPLIIPAAPPPPTTAMEQNQAAVTSSLDDIRRRPGTAATILTGGLGDSSYGTNVQGRTLLGA